MMPVGDHTPDDFSLPRESWVEKIIKAPVRRYLYPVYNAVAHQWLSHKYRGAPLRPDLWMSGNRGNDYPRNRARVNCVLPLRGKKILVVGCGSGRDIDSWLHYRPELLTGVDYLDYRRAWDMLRLEAQRRYPDTRLEFRQADLKTQLGFSDESFDVVGSDAVLEHVTDFPAALKEIHRVLRPGGVLYASYGPLWYCWGGDHVSGFDSNAGGYNHVLLPPATYREYLAKGLETVGSIGILSKYDLFSYMRPAEYLSAFATAGFDKIFCSLIIEPRAVRCLEENPELRQRLLRDNAELDLITTGMIIVYRKRA